MFSDLIRVGHSNYDAPSCPPLRFAQLFDEVSVGLEQPERLLKKHWN